MQMLAATAELSFAAQNSTMKALQGGCIGRGQTNHHYIVADVQRPYE